VQQVTAKVAIAEQKLSSVTSELEKMKAEAAEFKKQGVREVKVPPSPSIFCLLACLSLNNPLSLFLCLSISLSLPLPPPPLFQAEVKVAVVNCDTADGSAQEACVAASLGQQAGSAIPVLELWKRQYYPFPRVPQRVMSTNEKGNIHHQLDSAFDLLVQASTALADTWVLQEKVAPDVLNACRVQEVAMVAHAAAEKEKRERKERLDALATARSKLDALVAAEQQAHQTVKEKQEALKRSQQAVAEYAAEVSKKQVEASNHTNVIDEAFRVHKEAAAAWAKAEIDHSRTKEDSYAVEDKLKLAKEETLQVRTFCMIYNMRKYKCLTGCIICAQVRNKYRPRVKDKAKTAAQEADNEKGKALEKVSRYVGICVPAKFSRFPPGTRRPTQKQL
jgi:hypothetical protein